jgi:hypothetical protein
MALSANQMQGEIIGPIVSVDNDDYIVDTVNVGGRGGERVSPSASYGRGESRRQHSPTMSAVSAGVRLQIPRTVAKIVPPGIMTAGTPLHLVTGLSTSSKLKSPGRSSAHQIVTETSERVRIVGSTGDGYGRSNGRSNSNGGISGFRPKFSEIVNEYMGVCFEDHCAVGRSCHKFFPLPQTQCVSCVVLTDSSGYYLLPFVCVHL